VGQAAHCPLSDLAVLASQRSLLSLGVLGVLASRCHPAAGMKKMGPREIAPMSMLIPWLAEAGQHPGVGDTMRARVTWGQGLPSSPEARPVLEVPAHRHPAIPV